jgi:hypothetical protein
MYVVPNWMLSIHVHFLKPYLDQVFLCKPQKTEPIKISDFTVTLPWHVPGKYHVSGNHKFRTIGHDGLVVGLPPCDLEVMGSSLARIDCIKDVTAYQSKSQFHPRSIHSYSLVWQNESHLLDPCNHPLRKLHIESMLDL